MEISERIPESTVRNEADMGHAILRARRHFGLTQSELGENVRMKQATVSSLENGNPGTTLRTLFLALSALDLEIVVRPRSKVKFDDWGSEP